MQPTDMASDGPLRGGTKTGPPPRSLVAWRRDELVRAGFDAELGDRLAAARDLDLHAVLDLVDRGCPPPLAARILAPLTDTPDPVRRSDDDTEPPLEQSVVRRHHAR